jgi:hemoglobin
MKLGCAKNVLMAALAAQAAWVVGCASKSPARIQRPQPVAVEPAPAPKPVRPTVAKRGTLYERMGGEPVVRAVVDDLVTRAASDPALNFARKGHGDGWQATPESLDHLKHGLVTYLTTTAGGPLQYRGSDMVSAHRGMAISNAEFDAFVRHLAAALEANHVPGREREELVRAVNTTRVAIVEAPDAPPAPAPTAEAPAPAPEAPQPEQPTAEAPQTEVVPTEPAPQEAAPEAAPVEAQPHEPMEPGISEEAAPEEPSAMPNESVPNDAAPQDAAPEPADATPDAPAYDEDDAQAPLQ